MSRKLPRSAFTPRAFTMVELMIVVAIIAILSTLAVPSYFYMVEKVHKAEAVGLLNGLYNLEVGYLGEYQHYGCMHQVGFEMEGHGHFGIQICASVATGCVARPDLGIVICDCDEYPIEQVGWVGAEPGAVPSTDSDCPAFMDPSNGFEADANNWCNRAVPSRIDWLWIIDDRSGASPVFGKNDGYFPQEQNPPDQTGC